MVDHQDTQEAHNQVADQRVSAVMTTAEQRDTAVVKATATHPASGKDSYLLRKILVEVVLACYRALALIHHKVVSTSQSPPRPLAVFVCVLAPPLALPFSATVSFLLQLPSLVVVGAALQHVELLAAQLQLMREVVVFLDQSPIVYVDLLPLDD